MSHEHPGAAAGALTLSTSDGISLEGEFAEAAPQNSVGAKAITVLCHPHPQYGGNMRASVIEALFRALPQHRSHVLRFNFRGVGESEGHHDAANAHEGERQDAIAALDEAAQRWPDLPILLAGWSFGADISLSLDDPRITRWLAIAPPMALIDPATMLAASDPRGKHLAIPAHDDYNPPARALPLIEAWRATTTDTIAGADHFLNGHLDRVAAIAAAQIDVL